MISGIVTILLMVIFAGITAWAYSARNRARFEDAANLPLRDEAGEKRPPDYGARGQA